jgi:hypothetical protein
MTIDDRAEEFWQATNQGGMATSNPYPTVIPSIFGGGDGANPTQQPTGQGVFKGDGVISMGAGGGYTSMRLLLVPYGNGAAGGTFSMQVYRWQPTTGSFYGRKGNNNKLWIPVLLATYNVVLGPAVGVTSSDLTPDCFFANSIICTYGGPLLNVTGATPDNVVYGAGPCAMIVQRVYGARYVQVVFNVGTATGANCLYTKQ